MSRTTRSAATNNCKPKFKHCQTLRIKYFKVKIKVFLKIVLLIQVQIYSKEASKFFYGYLYWRDEILLRYTVHNLLSLVGERQVKYSTAYLRGKLQQS